MVMIVVIVMMMMILSLEKWYLKLGVQPPSDPENESLGQETN